MKFKLKVGERERNGYRKIRKNADKGCNRRQRMEREKEARKNG